MLPSSNSRGWIILHSATKCEFGVWSRRSILSGRTTTNDLVISYGQCKCSLAGLLEAYVPLCLVCCSATCSSPLRPLRMWVSRARASVFSFPGVILDDKAASGSGFPRPAARAVFYRNQHWYVPQQARALQQLTYRSSSERLASTDLTSAILRASKSRAVELERPCKP